MVNKEEIWADIAGYEGFYKVSNKGNVESLKRVDLSGRQRGGSLSLIKCINGYLEVKLCKNGHYRRVTVHRLVAMAFIPNPENKKTVNHIDSNRHNNILENLEWCTHRENTSHGIVKGHINNKGENNKTSKLTNKIVLFIRSSDLTSKELSTLFNVSSGHINSIKRKKVWAHL